MKSLILVAVILIACELECGVALAGAAAVGWSKHDGKYLGGYSSGVAMYYDTLEQAQAECIIRTDCGGITYETSSSKKYTLRRGADLRDSSSAEISWKVSESDCADNSAHTANCGHWESNGYCDSGSEHYEFMKINCARSCAFCDENCGDKSQNCGGWASSSAGFCDSGNTFYDYMTNNCARSCGFCTVTKKKKEENAVSGGRGSYALAKPLAVGDVIEAWGIYKDDTTSAFNVNIVGENGLFLLHVDFRPFDDKVILSNKVNGAWGQEVRPAFSRSNFRADETFKVTIEVLGGQYKISFNDVEIGGKFPQRDDPALATAVALYGGSNGFQWTNVKVPKMN